MKRGGRLNGEKGVSSDIIKPLKYATCRVLRQGERGDLFERRSPKKRMRPGL